nr:hypothetical protein [Tanacetum cinerariifolium]
MCLKNEPRFDDDEANLQREVEESLKDVHATHQGTLPPVVFREPNLGEVNQFQRRKPKTTDPTGPSIHHEDEKATRTDVETDTEELLTYTEKSGEEVSNTVVLVSVAVACSGRCTLGESVVFLFSASEGLSLKNWSPKLKSLARCCREDK